MSNEYLHLIAKWLVFNVIITVGKIVITFTYTACFLCLIRFISMFANLKLCLWGRILKPLVRYLYLLLFIFLSVLYFTKFHRLLINLRGKDKKSRTG